MHEITMKQAILRGLMGRCPCCGKGALFTSYLKPAERCSVCGEHFAGLKAQDAAPWLTIIVIGHIFLPLAFMIDTAALPAWLVATVMASVFAGLGAVLLPRSKGVILAILWQTHATAEPELA